MDGPKPMKRERAIRLAKRELRGCAHEFWKAMEEFDWSERDDESVRERLRPVEEPLYAAARALVAAEALPPEEKP